MRWGGRNRRPATRLGGGFGCIVQIAWTWRPVFKFSLVEDAAGKLVLALEPTNVVDVRDVSNDVMGVSDEFPDAFSCGFFGGFNNEHPSVVKFNERKFKQDRSVNAHVGRQPMAPDGNADIVEVPRLPKAIADRIE